MASFPKTIGTTVDIRTIAVDKNRKSFAVFNTHGLNTAYMKEGGTVAVANGIPIYPQGNVSLSVVEDGDSVKEAWSFIADGANTTIVIFEGSR